MRPRLYGVVLAASFALAAGLPGRVWAQDPSGAEFRVNTFTTNYQYSRANAVAAGGNGSFVVVWESPQDGSGYAVMTWGHLLMLVAMALPMVWWRRSEYVH